MSTLPHDAFVETLRRLQLTPEIVLNIPELLALFVPLLRTDFALDERCVHSGARCIFSFPLVLMHGKEDNIISKENMLAWEEYTTASCTFKSFQGGHVFFNDDPWLVLNTIFAALPTTMREEIFC